MNEIEKPIWEKKEEYSYSHSSDENYWKKHMDDNPTWLYGSGSIWLNNPKMKFDLENGYYIFVR